MLNGCALHEALRAANARARVCSTTGAQPNTQQQVLIVLLRTEALECAKSAEGEASLSETERETN